MMRFHKRGIVAKISGNNCIVLTPQGTYAKISRPSRETRIGEEIAYNSNWLSATIKPMLLVASLLLVWFVFPLLQQLVVPHQAVAYVSLDIHNGVEMAVDKNMKIITARSYDDETAALIKALNIEGGNLNDAVASIIGQAAALDYITAGGNNMVVSTVSPSSKTAAQGTVDQAELYQTLVNSLASQGLAGQVKVYAVSEDLRIAARDQQLTAGKYLIYQQLLNSGHEVSLAQVSQLGVNQLAADYDAALMPGSGEDRLPIGANGQNLEIRADEKALSVAEGDSSVPTAMSDADGKRSDTVSRAYQRDVSGRLTDADPIQNKLTGV